MTAVSTAAFDPAVYKETTRLAWERAASAWDGWGGVLERWLAEATEVMLDNAGVTCGSRVLDVAAGAGGQAIAAAERTGPGGFVLATDIAEGLVLRTRVNVAAAGVRHVGAAVADAERLDVEPQWFDAAVCRLGLMFLPDLGAALAGIRQALRPGGRVAAVVYSQPERTPFYSIPIAVIRRRAGLDEPPGQPGPFGLGDPGVLVAALREAGFEQVHAELLDAPLRLRSAADCVRLERESFAALHQLMAGLDRTGRADAWHEIENELRAFEGPHGFDAPGELLVASGTRP